ncbi:MAG: penicillin-binding protein activator [Burkholderiales bacterium]|nr:penicillin-binding protein activator [Burkholderiales bacterium]
MLPAHCLRRVFDLLVAVVCSSAALCAAQGIPASDAAGGKRAIALVLPFYAPELGAAAEAVRQGVETANRVSGGRYAIQLWHTDASPARVVQAYESAIVAGARAVIGPMTRAGVAALARGGVAREGPPVVALNQPDAEVTLPPRFFAFGLALDAEARVVARLVWRQGLRTVAVVGTQTPLARRSTAAFVDEWLRLGGNLTEIYEVPQEADLVALRDRIAAKPAEAVFMAADPGRAAALRPYLGNQALIFSTSQVNSSGTARVGALDLAGVRFVEMPWLLRPDDRAVAAYPRPPGLGGDLERLFALGIDAFRIAAALAEGTRSAEIDGVTGRIRLAPPNSITREPHAATFRAGVAVPLE